MRNVDIATEYLAAFDSLHASMKCINVIILGCIHGPRNFRTGHFSLPAARTDIGCRPRATPGSPRLRSGRLWLVRRTARKGRQVLWDQDALCSKTDVTILGAHWMRFISATLHRFGRSTASEKRWSQRRYADCDVGDDEWRSDYELKSLRPCTWPTGPARLGDDARGDRERARDMARTPNPTPRRRRVAPRWSGADQVARERGPSQRHSGDAISSASSSRAVGASSGRANVALEDFYATMAANGRSRLGRVGRAEEVADLAAVPLSPRASYVTASASASTVGCRPSSDAPLDRNSEW